MLIRNRLSRIYFLRKFFDYPLSLNLKTILDLGILRTIKIGLSYVKVCFFPVKEKSLEGFFTNRFGKELYVTFFKDYTEKLWGINCNKLSPEWGVQRVKGLSIKRAITDAIKYIFVRDKFISQRKTETSLIKKFMYPKFGPGQFWNEVANVILRKGGEIHKNHTIIGINYKKGKVIEVNIKNGKTGDINKVKGDYFFSTMPVKELVYAFGENVSSDILRVAQGLIYRDFITVGVLLKRLKLRNKRKYDKFILDNWIYIQEKDVKLGRIQIFNNWSPYLVKEKDNVWLGLEYFCSEGDWLWSKKNIDISRFAVGELVKMGFIEKENVLDAVVVKVPKTYPVYYGTYKEFRLIRDFTDGFENLFLIGRNGMHRYNNSDHSMLTAMVAVDNIVNKRKDKSNIWAINTEEEYHEEN